ncbi:hypothetical protein [Agarilytica rhodophyticola]|uniref:hypothetical protein n=1 Tax=Agarilytica rhodophyticola TaxID=1737490 RepID=UPI001C1F5F0C|nr:hypothetical protein [Agarilytica rhodophyticola]
MRKGVEVRVLTYDDIAEILILEKKQWVAEQIPSAEDIKTRITDFPELSIGAFCLQTGRALASLFMKPTDSISGQGKILKWSESVQHRTASTTVLFGISLTSVNSIATMAIFEFFYPIALKKGYKKIYIGSPIPGLRSALEKNSQLSIEEYVYKKRPGDKKPLDPQLHYYYNKGFHKIVAIKHNYFPHENSMDYGVILCGKIPLSTLSFLWRYVPVEYLKKLASVLFFFLKAPSPITMLTCIYSKFLIVFGFWGFISKLNRFAKIIVRTIRPECFKQPFKFKGPYIS